MAETKIRGITTKGPLKLGLFKWPLRILACLLALTAAYLLVGWIGSSIARNGDWVEPDEGVTILIETNGFHTGIVVPMVNDVKDWREVFPEATGPRIGDGRIPTHLAIGWGEAEIFLKVAEMKDLDLATALRITTIGGDSLLRVTPYVRPMPDTNHRPLRISREQYAQLAASFEAALPPIPVGEQREVLRSTYSNEAFYRSYGRYNFAQTCNVWISNRLADAGIKTGLWTPLSGGVMKWVEWDE